MEATTLAEANAIIAQLTGRVATLERQIAWAEGRRADGVRCVSEFTETETRILRILASTGEARHGHIESLYRHMSNIRKKLRKLNPRIEIKTIVNQGYQVVSGMAALKKLVSGEGKVRALVAPPSPEAFAQVA